MLPQNLRSREGHTSYDAFGNEITFTSTHTPNVDSTIVLYVGEPLDAGTNYYRMGAREYAPSTGRFATADQTVIAPGDVSNSNLYVYVGGNPVNATDPTGELGLGDLLAYGGMALGFMAEQLPSITLAWGYTTLFFAGMTMATSPLARLERTGQIHGDYFQRLNESYGQCFELTTAGLMILDGLPQLSRNSMPVNRAPEMSEEEEALYSSWMTLLRRKQGIGKDRTVSGIDGVVDGKPVCAYSLSGKPSDQQAADGMTKPTQNPQFSNSEGYTSHAEQTLSEWFAQKYAKARSGWIRLIIQHPRGGGPCFNCEDVIKEFRAMFRGRVDIDVVVLPPPPVNQPQAQSGGNP